MKNSLARALDGNAKVMDAGEDQGGGNIFNGTLDSAKPMTNTKNDTSSSHLMLFYLYIQFHVHIHLIPSSSCRVFVLTLGSVPYRMAYSMAYSKNCCTPCIAYSMAYNRSHGV